MFLIWFSLRMELSYVDDFWLRKLSRVVSFSCLACINVWLRLRFIYCLREWDQHIVTCEMHRKRWKIWGCYHPSKIWWFKIFSYFGNDDGDPEDMEGKGLKDVGYFSHQSPTKLQSPKGLTIEAIIAIKQERKRMMNVRNLYAISQM